MDEIREKSVLDKQYYDSLSKDYFKRHNQPIQRYSTRLESKWLRELVIPNSKVINLPFYIEEQKIFIQMVFEPL